MKANRFRTHPPVSRFVPAPAKAHATVRTPKPSFFRRFLKQWVSKRETIALELALAGCMYMAGRYVTGILPSPRMEAMATMGTFAALMMLISALLLSIWSDKDGHRTKE